MTEKKLQIVTILKFLAALVGASLYAIGGMEGTSKGVRRVGTSIFITLALVGFSLWQNNFNWLYLLYSLLLWGSYSLGYGSDDTKIKVLKRIRWGLAVAIASLVIAIPNGAWVLFAYHCGLCVSTSVIMGVINPLKAREEETILGWVSVITPLFMI